ncbi:hypothetical protein SAMN02745206_01592 [Desulfacinum infernum DSM 9756]|jgi:hypothetical protein|uniref:Uncharacterized protein n=1 Tax=Desulfacinum infernum DSM 9756 TaxID=1121391 RepID=A0A1M5A1D8_9BACT|nr:hypothetical protein SAMN02745206_01592 [Desulfacinum infernum DSM 9756]
MVHWAFPTVQYHPRAERAGINPAPTRGQSVFVGVGLMPDRYARFWRKNRPMGGRVMGFRLRGSQGRGVLDHNPKNKESWK